MADIDTLVIRIEGDNKNALGALDSVAQSIERIDKAAQGLTGISSLTDSLKKLRSVFNNLGKGRGAEALQQFSGNIRAIAKDIEAIDIKRLEHLAEVMRSVNTSRARRSAISSVAEAGNLASAQPGASNFDATPTTVAVENQNDALNENAAAWNRAGKAQEAAQGASKKAESAYKNLTASIRTFTRDLSDGGGKIAQFVSSIKRILMYRAIRSALKAITSAIREGINNVYQYSKAFGGTFAASMDKISTSALYLKNSLGAMAAPLLNALAPIVDFLIDKFVDLLNVINRVFAALSGASTWTKAIKYPKTFASGVDKATGAVKALKATVLGIDELNLMNGLDAGGGGGAGGGENYGAMFEEVELSQEEAKNLKSLFEDIAIAAGAIALAIKGWQLSNSFLKGLAGAAVSAAGLYLEFKGLSGILKNGIDWGNFTESLTGGGLIVTGATMVGQAFGNAFLGAAIGAVVAGIPMYIVGIIDSIKNEISVQSALLTAAGATLAGAGIGAIVGMLGGPIGAGVGALIGLAVGALTDLGIWIAQNWESIVAKTKEIWEKVTTWFDENIIQPISTFFSDLWTNISTWASDSWEAIKGFFKDAGTWFDTNVTQPISQFFSDMWDDISQWASDSWEKIKKFFKDAGTWFDTNVIQPISTFFSDLWDDISQWASESWEKIKKFFEPAVEWFSTLWDSIKQTASDIWYDIQVIATGCWEVIKEVWRIVSEWFDQNVIQPVKNFFSDLWDDISQWASDSWEKVKEVWRIVSEWFDQNVLTPVKNFFKSAWEKITTFPKNAWEAIKNAWRIASTWFDERVLTPIKNFFTNRWISISQKAKDAWLAVKDCWRGLSTWFDERVLTPLKNFFANKWTSIVQKAKDAWTGIKSVFSSVGTFFSSTFSEAWRKVVAVFSSAGSIFTDIKDGIVTAFKKIVNGLITGLNRAIAAPFNGINTALRKIKNISILGMYPFSGLREISVPVIPYLAEGGIVDSGQLFVAREAGPELVGNVGNRTGVMNNDQIVDAVSRGVYDANMEQNALLREEIDLLRRILAKDASGGGISTSDVIDAFNRMNRRAGKTLIPV